MLVTRKLSVIKEESYQLAVAGYREKISGSRQFTVISKKSFERHVIFSASHAPRGKQS